MRSALLSSALARAIADRLARVFAPVASSSQRSFIAAGVAVGRIDGERCAHLARWPDVFRFTPGTVELQPALTDEPARTAALARVARSLGEAGLLSAWRDERYAVAPAFGASPVFQLERAAARFFGIWTYAAHVNGLVRSDQGTAMWLARRSPHKALDPGLLDNLVGGGIAAEASVEQTVVKESWEEAGIEPALARQAYAVGTVSLSRLQPQGVQRERIFMHDLWLPAAFVPANQDGEAVEHRLLSLPEAGACIAGDDMTADASLVALSFLLRNGCFAADDPSFTALDAWCRCASALSPAP